MGEALAHLFIHTKYRLKSFMKTSTKVAAGVVAALVLGVVALNPRAKVDDGKLYAISCTTKHFYMPTTTADNGMTVPGGLYNAESYIDQVMPQAMAAYTKETAGNPFQGLGLMLMPAFKGPLVTLANQAIKDACEGNDLSYLEAIASYGSK